MYLCMHFVLLLFPLSKHPLLLVPSFVPISADWFSSVVRKILLLHGHNSFYVGGAFASPPNLSLIVYRHRLKKSRCSEQKGTRQSLPCAYGQHKMHPRVSFLQKSNWRVWIRALKMEDASYRMPFTEGRQDIILMMSEEALPTPPVSFVRKSDQTVYKRG